MKKMLAGTTLYVRDERDGVFRIATNARPKALGAALIPGSSDRPGEVRSGARSCDPPPSPSSAAQPNQSQTNQPNHNQSPPVKNRNLFSILAGLLAAGSGLDAQTVPSSPTGSPGITAAEPAIVLSPFVIDASTETGWVSTQTLAGSRMKTDFKDLATPIEVMTKDFLDDLGLTNFSQALLYSTNIEGREDIVTDDGSSPGHQAGGPGESTPVGRIRGVAAATLSRDFFEGYMPTDNYNLERITIARGPNAILFGLGSPAGIVDVSSKRGDLRRNSAGVELQWNSENSKRSSLDLNRVLLKDRLALRVDAMSAEEVTHVKPNLRRQDRYYGVISARPFKGTTVNLNAERVRQTKIDVARSLPLDGYSVWENANQIAGSPYATGRPLFDNRTIPANIATANSIFARETNAPVLLQNAGAISGSLQGWNNSVVVREPQGIPAAFNPYNSLDRFSFSVPDDKVIPFDVNPLGTSRSDRSRSDRISFFVERKITEKLFLELAYNKEDYYVRMTGSAGFPVSPLIQVDANRFLPDGVTPNPNVGRYYFEGAGYGREFWQNRQDMRAVMSYEFDAGRQLKNAGGWSRWLGRHRLAGLFSRADATARDQQVTRRFLDSVVSIPGVTMQTGSAGTGTTGTGTLNWASAANRNFITRFYNDNPRGSHASNPISPEDGTWFFSDSAGRRVGAYLFDSPYKTADGIKLDPGTGAAGSKSKIDSQMLAWQGYFWRDRLVLLYGYRKDNARSAALDARYQTVDWSGLTPSAENAEFGAWGPTQSGITRSRGAILHLTEWASLGYSKSNTFQINIGRYDPFGNEYPGANGAGDDLSVNFSFFGRKLTIRAERFTNNGGPTRAANGNDPLRNQLWNLETQIRTLDPSLPTINVGRGGYRDLGRPNYWVMSDTQSKGYELEIGWNPAPNWSFRLNAAKQDVVETNIGTAWFDWVAQRLPVWQSLNVLEGGRSTPSDVNGDGRIGTWTWSTAPMTIDATRTTKQYFDEVIVPSLAYIQAIDGRNSFYARGLRANFIGQYRISEGRLKGLFTSAALRFRGPPTTGFGVKTLPDGTLAYNLDQTFKGENELITDLGLGYRGRLKAFSGLRYRAQLNVRNALGSDDLIPVKALTTGREVRFASVEPRTFVFTFAFEL